MSCFKRHQVHARLPQSKKKNLNRKAEYCNTELEFADLSGNQEYKSFFFNFYEIYKSQGRLDWVCSSLSHLFSFINTGWFVLSFLFYLPPKHVSQPFFSWQVVVELERANSAGSESDLGQLYICTTHAHCVLLAHLSAFPFKQLHGHFIFSEEFHWQVW